MAEIALYGIEFIIGLVILIKGCDVFINGASGIATKLGISEHMVGLTFVAIATSLPELAVSSFASYNLQPGLAIGNIIGSNVSNICLVLGIAAIIMHLVPNKETIRDALYMIFSSILLLLLILIDGDIGRFDSLLFLLLYCYFVYHLYMRHKKSIKPVHATKEGTFKEFLYVIIGAAGVLLGAHFLVESGVNIAQFMGVSPVIIGLTIIAVGTSLPELASTVTAALKKRHGIAVGNIIGSNIINIFLVLGVSGLINPIHAGEKIIITAPFLIGVSFLTLFFVKRKIGRKQGFLLLLLYGLFLVVLFF